MGRVVERVADPKEPSRFSIQRAIKMKWREKLSNQRIKLNFVHCFRIWHRFSHKSPSVLPFYRDCNRHKNGAAQSHVEKGQNQVLGSCWSKITLERHLVRFPDPLVGWGTWLLPYSLGRWFYMHRRCQKEQPPRMPWKKVQLIIIFFISVRHPSAWLYDYITLCL